MLQVVKPSLYLAPYIKEYWFVKIKDAKEKPQRLVPFESMALSFHKGKPAYSSREAKNLPESYLSGISTEYTDLIMSGYVDFITIIFQPLGIKSFFLLPFIDFSNCHISLSDLNDSGLNELEKKLQEISDGLKCVEVIEHFLFKRFVKVDDYKNSRMHIVLNLLAKGENDLSVLAGEACLGYKQFKRIFMESIGVTPKAFLQIVRFQKLHRFLQLRADATISELAFQCNYYDKSHLIREVKHFSGFTPRELLHASEPEYSLYHSLFRSAFVDLPYDI